MGRYCNNRDVHDWPKMSVCLGTDCEYRHFLFEQQEEGAKSCGEDEQNEDTACQRAQRVTLRKSVEVEGQPDQRVLVAEGNGHLWLGGLM